MPQELGRYRLSQCSNHGLVHCTESIDNDLFARPKTFETCYTHATRHYRENDIKSPCDELPGGTGGMLGIKTAKTAMVWFCACVLAGVIKALRLHRAKKARWLVGVRLFVPPALAQPVGEAIAACLTDLGTE